MIELQTSTDWLKSARFTNLLITDPDGWNRQDFVASIDELISEDEFERRLKLSTSIYVDYVS